MPNGLLPAIIVMQGVVFAYASIELIGTAAGETENPEKVMPKAINTVDLPDRRCSTSARVLLLSLLLPYTAYQAGVSPFVTFFGSIGIDGVDAIMNLVVLTAALSSLNAGLYSTGRILRSMSDGRLRAEVRRPDEQGRCPLRRHRPHRRRHPARRRPERRGPRRGLRDRPERRLRWASLVTWATIVLCQIQLARLGQEGTAAAPVVPDVRAPLHRLISSWSSWSACWS